MNAFWSKQIRIRNEILKGERDAAATRTATPLYSFDPFLAAERRAQEAEAARAERDRVATEADRSRKQRQAQAMQDAQRAWAEKRNALRADIVVLQQALASAEQRMVSGELDDAVRAAGEVEVYRVRLEAAQSGFAMHARQSPM